MEVIQQTHTEVIEQEPNKNTKPRANKQAAPICSKLKSVQLSIELGNNYIVWSINKTSLTSSKICNSGLITETDICNPEIACQHLEKIIAENNITRGNVNLYLSLTAALLRCSYIPVVPKNELAQVVKWEANKVFPFKLDTALYDWKIVDTVNWGGVKKYEVQIAAIPKLNVAAIIELLKSKGLQLNRITFAALAWEDILRLNDSQSKSKNSPKDNDTGNVALARMVGNDLTLLFFQNYYLEFMRENNIESGNLSGGFEESLRFLNETEDGSISQNIDAESIDFEIIAKNITDSLDYYFGQFSQRNIDKILISFPPQIAAQAIEKLQSLLGIEIVTAYDEKVPLESPGNVPAHLLLPSGDYRKRKIKSLNILPTKYRLKLKEKKHLKISVYTAIIALAFILGLSVLQFMQMQNITNANRNLQENINLMIASQPYQLVQDLLTSENNILMNINNIDQKSLTTSNLLKALSQITPQDIRITQLEMFSVHTDDGLKKYLVTLSGFTVPQTLYPEISLAEYIKALRLVPQISGVILVKQELRLQTGGQRLLFNLNMELIPNG